MSGSINAVLGWENALDMGALTVSAEEPTLPGANLRDPLGSSANAWQTPAGVTAAWVQSVPATPVAWRAVMLARTNLSASATVRVRLGDVASLVEEGAIINQALTPGNVPGTFTRASVAWSFNAAGVLVQSAANVPRFHFVAGQAVGLLMEAAVTNRALWSRDFTQAAWVKTNLTATLVAAGIDNTPASASRLTATAANATALQTVTLASGARIAGFYMRRAGGTGAVQITINGGANWQAVTLTNNWQRFEVAATVTNPQIGVRIVTSGDIVDVDCAQFEDATPLTSPIITTSAAVTRAAETLLIQPGGFPAQAGTFAAEAMQVVSNSALQTQVRDASAANFLAARLQALGFRDMLVNQSGVNVHDGNDFPAPPVGTLVRQVIVYGSTSTHYANNTTVGSYSHGGPLGVMDRLLLIPTRGAIAVARVALYAQQLTATQAAALSATWSTIVPTAYDSGALGGVSRGQWVHLLPSAVTAAACRVDIADPGNPDGFLNVPLIYAGPAWQMATNISRESAQVMADGARRTETRGGQQHVEEGWLRRGWEIRLENHRATDAEQRLLDLERAARRGTNILCIPRPLTEPARDAVFGLAEQFTPLRFGSSSGALRSLGFTITERL